MRDFLRTWRGGPAGPPLKGGWCWGGVRMDPETGKKKPESAWLGVLRQILEVKYQRIGAKTKKIGAIFDAPHAVNLSADSQFISANPPPGGLQPSESCWLGTGC